MSTVESVAATVRDQLEHLAHRRALADDVVEAARSPRCDRLSCTFSATSAAVLERLLDQAGQLVGVERLRDVVVGAVLQRLDRVVHGGVGGHHDDDGAPGATSRDPLAGARGRPCPGILMSSEDEVEGASRRAARAPPRRSRRGLDLVAVVREPAASRESRTTVSSSTTRILAFFSAMIHLSRNRKPGPATSHQARSFTSAAARASSGPRGS